MKEKKLRKLIKRAMGDVEVIRCPRCNGEGEIGLPSLRGPCPECGGRGKTTNGASIAGAGVAP